MPNYKPHPKQAQVHNAKQKRIILNWGRQCLSENTLIETASGSKPISEVKRGDLVWSRGDKTELKEVISTHCFGVDDNPKPMIKCKLNGTEINASYDHEIFTGEWLPLYQLAWGGMGEDNQRKLRLLCEQYGENLLDIQESGDEASDRLLWLLEDCDGREDSKGAPCSCGDLAGEPSPKTASQPYKWQKAGQLSREPRVGELQREFGSRYEERLKSEKARGELNEQDNGEASAGDSGGATSVRQDKPGTSQRTSPEVPPEARFNKRHTQREKLVISEVEVSEVQTSYDLTVADNYNYYANGILVHNTGKTLFAVNYAWIEAVKRQGRYFIVFPTYQQSYDAMFSQYISYIPKQLIREIDKSRLIIRLHHIKGKMKLPDGTEIEINHDEDQPSSTIELKGSDTTTADRLRGSRVHGIIFDEYAYQDPGKWERIFEPMLSTTDGFAMFISSPQGYNHFYDLWMYAQKNQDKWFSSHATGYDNPLVSDEFLEDKKKEAMDNDNLLTFQQEYMAEFKQRSGLVYSVFDRNVHIFKPEEMPKTGTRLLGMDWGYEHPFAAVYVLVDHEENWWVYDEVYIRKKTPEVWLELLKNKIGSDHITIAAADSAGPEHIAFMAKNGIPIVPVKKAKNSIRDGIQLIRQRMMPREQLHGPPQPKLRISTNCPNLILELESYVYPEGNLTPGEKTKEDPVKEWDDALDALRYIALVQQESFKQDFSAFEESSIYNGGSPWSI